MKNVMSLIRKKLPLITTVLAFSCVIIEFLLWLSVPYIVRDARSFPDDIFQDVNWKNDRNLGWDAYGGQPRPTTNLDLASDSPCVYVYGDSFSHADEVSDTDAWPNQLEEKLGCRVINYGVGGYGTDQSYLKMKQTLPNSAAISSIRPIVLFGVYQEMLRRNVAASWLFYCCSDSKRSLKPYYSINSAQTDLVLHELPSSISISDIKKHHLKDRYQSLYNLEFPYLYTTLRNLYYRINYFGFNSVALEPRTKAYADPDTVFIQSKLMEKARDLALKRGYNIGFVYFSTPEQASFITAPYASFISSLSHELKDNNHVFTIDTHNKLYEKTSTLKGSVLRAPHGHYDSLGNEVIADAIHHSLTKKVVRFNSVKTIKH